MSHSIGGGTPVCGAHRPSGLRAGLQIDRLFYALWAVTIAGLLVVAVMAAPSSVQSNDAGCMAALAARQQVSVEVFFQNPAGGDVVAQAFEQCSR